MFLKSGTAPDVCGKSYITTENQFIAVLWSIPTLCSDLYGHMLYLRADHETCRWGFNRADKFGQLERWCLFKFFSGAKEIEKEKKVDEMCVCERMGSRIYFGVFFSQFSYSAKTFALYYCTQILCKSVNPVFSPNLHSSTHFALYKLYPDSHTLQ